MSNFDINDLARSVGLRPEDVAAGSAAGAPARSSELDEVQGILTTQAATGQHPGPAGVTPTAPAAAAPEIDLEAVARANDTVPATPAVRKAANQLGVRLSALALINDGKQRITLDQVRDWAEATGRAARPATAAAVRPATGALVLTRTSTFDPGRSVSVNDYGTNPAIDDIRQVFPEMHAAAIAAGDPAPTLFATGDLPVFTASGLPTSALTPLPWPARAPAAAATSQAAAAEIINYFTPTAGRDREALAREALMFYSRSEGNLDYTQRVAAWLGKYVYRDGRWVHPAQASVF